MTLPPREQIWNEVLRAEQILRLRQPVDLAIAAAGGGVALWLGAEGMPPTGTLIAYLIALVAARCAAWLYSDMQEAKHLPMAPESRVARGILSQEEARRWLLALVGIALLMALYLGLYTLLGGPIILLLMFVYIQIKQRTYLSQLLLAVGFAWTVPMAYFALGQIPDKTGWLLFVAMTLWGILFATLYSLPRSAYEAKVGILSLAQLFGEGARQMSALLALMGLFGLWLLGQQAGLGVFFAIGLWSAGILFIYQSGLILWKGAEGAARAYRQQPWIALILFLGVVFDAICQCSSSGG